MAKYSKTAATTKPTLFLLRETQCHCTADQCWCQEEHTDVKRLLPLICELYLSYLKMVAIIMPNQVERSPGNEGNVVNRIGTLNVRTRQIAICCAHESRWRGQSA